MPIITAEIPYKDNCPVLTRMKAFVTKAGIVPTIEHVFRDGLGQPMDLSEFFPSFSKGSQSIAGDGKLLLRCKEIVAAPDATTNPILEVEGTCVEPSTGVVHFALTREMVKVAGVYQLSIMLADREDNGIFIENPILWVEPSLFTLDRSPTRLTGGLPSIQEIRQLIMDNHGNENLLLDDVEFSSDQIGYAVTSPLYAWNESPPPLRPPMDTRTFPFAGAWTGAICGHLFKFAAHNYRRNHLPYQAGGIAIDDQNKEAQYNAAANELLEEWKQFVTVKKYEINTSLFMGSVQSIYGGLFH